MQEFVGEDANRQKAVDDLLHAYLRIGQWIKIETDLNMGYARVCYQLGITVTLRENAVDAAIPLCLDAESY
jgi:hypothetical protein